MGKNGCINKAIMKLSGADVRIDESHHYPKTCNITGFHKQVERARELVHRALIGDDVRTEATPENILTRLKEDLASMCGFQFEAER